MTWSKTVRTSSIWLVRKLLISTLMILFKNFSSVSLSPHGIILKKKIMYRNTWGLTINVWETWWQRRPSCSGQHWIKSNLPKLPWQMSWPSIHPSLHIHLLHQQSICIADQHIKCKAKRSYFYERKKTFILTEVLHSPVSTTSMCWRLKYQP